MLSCKAYCESGIVGNRSRMGDRDDQNIFWEQKISNVDWDGKLSRHCRAYDTKSNKAKSDGPDGPQLADSRVFLFFNMG